MPDQTKPMTRAQEIAAQLLAEDATSGATASPPRSVSPIGAAFAGMSNLAGALTQALSLGTAPDWLSPQEYDTGSGLGDYMVNKLYPGLGGAAGMMTGITAMPAAQIPLREGAKTTSKLIARGLVGGQKFGFYEGAREGIEAVKGGETLEDVLGQVGKGTAVGAATGFGLGVIPNFPKWLGGAYGHSSASLSALTAIQGGSPTDIATSAIIGPLMTKMAGSPFIDPPVIKTRSDAEAIFRQEYLDAEARAVRMARQAQNVEKAETARLSEKERVEQQIGAVEKERGEVKQSSQERLARIEAEKAEAKTTLGDIYLGGALGPLEKVWSDFRQDVVWRPEAARRGKPRPVLPVVGNPLDAAALRSRETDSIAEFVKALPRGPVVDANFVRGMLMGEEVPPPRGGLTVKVSNPYGVGGEIVEPVGTVKRLYRAPDGKVYKPVGDVSENEAWASGATDMYAGIGGGLYGDVKGMRNSAESYLGWTNRAVVAESRAMKLKYNKSAFELLSEVVGDPTRLKVSARRQANRRLEKIGALWQQIGGGDLRASAEALSRRPDIAATVKGDKDPVGLIESAIKGRRLMDELRAFDNLMREQMGEPAIGYVDTYGPWIVKVPLWRQILLGSSRYETIGGETAKASPPSFLRIQKAKNPRAMARRSGEMVEYKRENRADILLADYIDHLVEDIYYTPAIKHNRAYADAMKLIGLEGSAKATDTYVNEVFLKETPLFSKIPIVGSGPLSKLMRSISANESKNIFSWNIAWALTTQIPSQGVAVARQGTPVPTIKGLEMFTNPAWRDWSQKNVSSLRMKGMPRSGVSQQDFLDTMNKLKNSKLDDVVDFITHMTEYQLSMLGAASGWNRGITARGMEPYSREIAEYMSTEVEKIQGVYNRESIVGILRSPDFGWVAQKFMSYNMGLVNQARELAGPKVLGRLGRVGHFREAYAKSGEQDAGYARRAVALGGWAAMMVISNMLLERVRYAPLWGVGSIPLAEYAGIDKLAGHGYQPGRGTNLMWRMINDWGASWHALDKYHNPSIMAKFVMRYLWPLGFGVAVDRAVSGIAALHNGGVKDITGKQIYKVDPDEWTVMIFGPGASRDAKLRRKRQKNETRPRPPGSVEPGVSLPGVVVPVTPGRN